LFGDLYGAADKSPVIMKSLVLSSVQ